MLNYLNSIRYSGRRTHRAVMTKEKLAEALHEAATSIDAVKSVANYEEPADKTRGLADALHCGRGKSLSHYRITVFFLDCGAFVR